MQTTTTYRSGAAKKAFFWSYSKLKNFEACPKRHYHVDILKQYKEDSEALSWGNKVHDMMANHISGKQELPAEQADMIRWTDEVFVVTSGGKKVDVRGRPGLKVLVEQQLAITNQFEPCDWFAPQAWYRAKVDLAWLLGPVGAAIDWKTGRVETESPQLALSAACMFIHHPQLQAIRSRYVFLKEDATTDLDINRSDLPKLWNDLWSRIEALKVAHDNTDYPPTPNRLCEKWCSVKSCPHNGTRAV